MHIIGSIVLACQSQKQLMLWAFMPLLTKTFSLKKKAKILFFRFFLASSLIMTEFSFAPIFLSRRLKTL